MGIQVGLLPLKIIKYFFTESNITVVPNNNSDMQLSASEELNVSSSIKFNERDKSLVQIKVNVSLPNNPPEGKEYNLYYNISVIGYFKNESKETVDHIIESMIHANGTAILLGAIRERIAASTANCPYGPYLLPALSVKCTKDKDNSDAPEQKTTHRNDK